MIDVYIEIEKVIKNSSIDNEQKRNLVMSLIREEFKKNQKVGVTLDDLRDYLKEKIIIDFREYLKWDKKIKNLNNRIKYRLSDVYGVFLSNNSFAFGYEHATIDERGFTKCVGYDCICSGISIPWGYKEVFKTAKGYDALVMNICELIPADNLIRDIYIEISYLAFLEKKINDFMKENPSLIDNILKKKRNVIIKSRIL